MEDIGKSNILIVDDKPENLISLGAVLEDDKVNLVKAYSGNEALTRILEYDFALVLLDVQMPDMDGFETAELMRVNKKTRHVPIIFVTAISKDKQHVFKGYESGAVDYIFKPLDPLILKNKVATFLDLDRQRRLIEKKKGELETANRKIIDQQKALVEEERLKVLLQMAGAAAHGLNQPLMVLLANLEMLDLVKDDHEKVLTILPKIRQAGEKISHIVKKIQNVRYDLTVNHDRTTKIINLDQKINILVVENSESSFKRFRTYFTNNPNINLIRSQSIEGAFNKLYATQFDIVLLSYDLPDGTGLDFLSRLNLENIDLPVVAVSGMGDDIIASNFLKAGAFDYLSKSSMNKNSLIKAIHSSMEKYGLRKEIDKSIKKMAEISTRDNLTGLYNRRYMESILKREVERARRYGSELCCLMLDLDFFKKINDTHGHLCGDYLLGEFSQMLKMDKRLSDALFRYGGEEFVVLLPQTFAQGAFQLAEKIRKECQDNQFSFEGIPLKITVSIGISSFKDTPVETAMGLVDLADKALYQAKSAGRNCVKIYSRP